MSYTTFKIPRPCTEDWNEMDATEQGAFCKKCTKEVVDLTEERPADIKHIIHKKSNPCIRILADQIDEMNWIEWFRSLTSKRKLNYTFLFSFIFVFHLNGISQEKDTLKTVIPIEKNVPDSTGKDSTNSCAPVEIRVNGSDSDQVTTVRMLEREIIMGLPPFNDLHLTLEPMGSYEVISNSEHSSFTSIGGNFLNFSIEEDELTLMITGRNSEKIQIRVYNEANELVLTDLLRIEKGYIELNYLLVNLDHGVYSIEIISPQETRIVNITY